MAPFLDLCHAPDPVGFARERLRFQPDPNAEATDRGFSGVRRLLAD